MSLFTKCRWRARLLLYPLLLTLAMVTTVQAQSLTPTPSGTTATVLYDAGLRAGPGAAQAVVGNVQAGEVVQVMTSSPDGNWVQLADGTWLATFFVRPNAQSARVTPTVPRLLVATATTTQTGSIPLPLTVTPTTAITSTRAAPTATRRRATPTPTQLARATALRNANLRAGPGTNYAVTGGVRANAALDLNGQTADGTWLQLRDGSWIAAFLVEQGATVLPTVAPTVIAGIPTAVPTATPTPPVVPTAKNTPVVASPPENTPIEAVEPTAPPSTGTSTFVVTRRRLWNPWENGGSTDGPSVHCGQGRNLVVNVLDENGNRINGVAVQAEYGAKEIHVTGAQGKGDGIVEFVLGGGQDVKVIRDADGSPVSSEAATGLSTDPRGIDQASLISAGYCQDEASCRTFANNLSCIGHYSWSVTFERRP